MDLHRFNIHDYKGIRPGRVFDERDSILPANPDAEAGVLSAILGDGSLFATVAPILSPDDFIIVQNRTIYEAMTRLASEGTAIDGITVCEEIGRSGDLDITEIHEMVTAVMQDWHNPANLPVYAGIVREKSLRRQAIEASENYNKEAYSNLLTAGEVIERQRERLEKLAAGVKFEPEEQAVTVRVSDVEAEAVDWLWPDRIPLGMLTSIAGDPGLGKSFLTHALAATVSIGATWPGGGGNAPRGSTLFLSAEDSVAATIRPRLEAAGADLSRVHVLSMVRNRNKRQRGFSLATDLDRLREVLDRIGDVRMIVIDPVSAYLGGSDEHKNGDVRGLLNPLKELVEEYKTACVMVTHINKGTGTKAIYRATGSIAFVAASRIAWLVVRDGDKPERRLLLPSKANIVADPTGMAYRIRDGVLEWEAEAVRMTADQALSEAAKQSEGKRGPLPEQTRKAMTWLMAHLATPQRFGESINRAKDAKISTQTFYKAMDALSVERFEIDGKKWLRLPKPEATAEAEPLPDF